MDSFACYDELMKRMLAIGGILVLLGISLFVFVLNDKAVAPDNSSRSDTSSSNEEQLPDGFNKEQYSLTDPASPWVVVNKKRPLPSGYIPEDLSAPNVRLRLPKNDEQMLIRRAIHGDLTAMFDAAKKGGVELVFGSGYRSETKQKSFYDQYVAQSGQAAADTFSARPRYSEHQTGLAFDLTTPDGSCHLEVCFKDTPGGKWVQEHASEYGFIIRYLDGKESITGYQYEPWHLRYVGQALSTEVKKTGQTLEEFFGLPVANTY
jgi:zinc D-Ala-D-Ala carboxypeptidase